MEKENLKKEFEVIFAEKIDSGLKKYKYDILYIILDKDYLLKNKNAKAEDLDVNFLFIKGFTEKEKATFYCNNLNLIKKGRYKIDLYKLSTTKDYYMAYTDLVQDFVSEETTTIEDLTRMIESTLCS